MSAERAVMRAVSRAPMSTATSTEAPRRGPISTTRPRKTLRTLVSRGSAVASETSRARTRTLRRRLGASLRRGTRRVPPGTASSVSP